MSDVDGQNEMFGGANVSKLEDGDILASLSAWARVLGVERETLRRRLVDAGVSSKGERSGHPVYGGRDVINAWMSGPDALIDPDSMSPFNRRAWYQGEHDKLKLQRERGELVPALEVEQTLGKLSKIFVLGLETLIDTVERDVGLTPLQAKKMEQVIDRLRESLHQTIAAETEGDPEVPRVQTSAQPRETKRPAGETMPGSALEEGIQFLRQALADGPRPTSELVAAAKEARISEGTLRRAKAKLGDEVAAQRQGKGWVWSMTLKPSKA